MLWLWIHLVGAICSIAHNLPRRTLQLSRRFLTIFGVIEEDQLCVSGCTNRQSSNYCYSWTEWCVPPTWGTSKRERTKAFLPRLSSKCRPSLRGARSREPTPEQRAVPLLKGWRICIMFSYTSAISWKWLAIVFHDFKLDNTRNPFRHFFGHPSARYPPYLSATSAISFRHFRHTL